MESLRIIFRPLAAGLDRDGFSCGDPDLDEFFQRDAMEYQRLHLAYTTVCLAEGSGRLLGFLTLACDAIRLEADERDGLPERPPIVPAIKLCRLGTRAAAWVRRW